MHREGWQRGWVRVYDRELVDPEGKRHAVHAVEGPAVANGGFIRAPRKPTNQSKSGGLRALGRSGITQEEEEEPQTLPPTMAGRFGYYYSTGWQSPFKYESAMYKEVEIRPAAAARFGGRSSCKAGRKFRHDEVKKYYLDAADVLDGQLDYLRDFDS
ncbi:hypothetical protein VPH35_053022 [Triticum aestivum]|uniref:Uncharacterized protein n=1 Tax=Triticum aestivum TaxID=4565 RepID=A0A077RZU7_WHEAT|nr:uncharacterized protein LOC123065659 [Triticum aestivum]CDM84162.1 unnamed protein product [Triticum aestivum]